MADLHDIDLRGVAELPDRTIDEPVVDILIDASGRAMIHTRADLSDREVARRLRRVAEFLEHRSSRRAN